MLGQQSTDLVAAQHLPAVRSRYGDRAPVGVGVVRDHDVGLDLARQLHREVHRAGLLRVGERHGREVRVGLGLRDGHVGRLEARLLQRTDDRAAADAVQRRVDDGQVAGAVTGELDDRCEVAVEDLVAENLAAGPAGDVADRTDGRDLRRDLLVGRRHDLAAVAEVDLVAVVLGRVVARRHHHPGHAAEVLDGEGQQWGGQGTGEHQRLEPRAGHHLGGVAGEDVGVVPGVVADDHGVPGPRPVGQEVRRQAGRRAQHHHPVHPVGPGAEGTAQAGRPELQGPVEPVLQLGRVVARDQRLELGPGRRVGVVLGPGPRACQQVGVGALSHPCRLDEVGRTAVSPPRRRSATRRAPAPRRAPRGRRPAGPCGLPAARRSRRR